MITPYRSRHLLVALLIAAGWAGCRDTDDPVGDERNRAPDTYLVQSPAFSQAGFYISHIFWDGYDSDGRVAYYEVAVTDSAGNIETAVWHPTFRTDSLVRFGVGGPSGTAQVLHHRFFVRAVDNLGRRDLDPAWILFQAKDFSKPSAEFTLAEGFRPNWPDTIPLRTPATCQLGFPPDTLPIEADVRFRWRGVDRDSLLGQEVGSVTAFEYKLVPIDAVYRGGTIADTMASYDNLAAGTYSFLVRPLDDAGWAGESCRYFQVNFDPIARIVKPFHSGLGENVSAFRVSDVRIASGANPCVVPVTTEPFVAICPAPEDPELPGWVMESDTLCADSDPAGAWFISFDVEAEDPDGTIETIEVNVGGCDAEFGEWHQPGEDPPPPVLHCTAPAWSCAARLDSETGGRVVVGPLTSGDWRIVVAAVDDRGQRGIAGSDTLIAHIDRSPYMTFDTPGIETSECDHLGGAVGDTITVCGNDTLYVITDVQGTEESAAPCAVTTAYAETGAATALSVNQYQAFPKPGERVELAFEPIGSDSLLAILDCLFWARDPDGAEWVSHARWSLDEPPGAIQGWENVVDAPGTTAEGQLSPICFPLPVIQTTAEAEHVLYIELLDWLEQALGGDVDVAQRVTRVVIPFTAVDISGKRTVLAGR